MLATYADWYGKEVTAPVDATTAKTPGRSWAAIRGTAERAQWKAPSVDGHHPAPLLGRHVADPVAGLDAGVADDEVDAAVLRPDRGEQGVDRVAVGDVEDMGRGTAARRDARGRDGGGAVAVDVGDQHVHTVRGEAGGHRLPESRSRAGHQGDAASEPVCHCCAHQTS
ncbi:hypothetical protein QI633_24910 [Nocardioides sp. QY071]|uniref:hypothetical protein n=1 Tax=Nocardioides sp. QY071 TaxID=3044187 RepID=UPI00249A423D|nr:hypothetical protein [Nocardioides sp. QY071]WGY04859.1 hypothetical protein QI633_24910 [Nocardioides sp. QY071]